jgi:hypothetical protein
MVRNNISFILFNNFTLASNSLTAPPPCSSNVISAAASSDNDPSAKEEILLTIEEINEIFGKQIKKLEESPNMEVSISKRKRFFYVNILY